MSIKTFIEKYDYMRNIFNEGFKRGKYLEKPNLLNIIKTFWEKILPLNHNHFIQIKKNEIKILQVYSNY